jgi:hypothetical protein
MSTARPATLAAATILALALSLTGCFPQIPTIPSVPVDIGGGNGSSDDGDGGDSSGDTDDDPGDVASLPQDWPAAVPILDGRITDAGTATLGDLTTWHANVRLDGDAEAAFDAGNTLLSDAGLTSGFAGFGDGDGASTWTSDELTVYFTITTNDDGSVSADYAMSTN